MILVSTFSSLQAFASGPAIYELAPGVVVDRDSGTVYTMHQDKSVEAIDLVSGNRLWISDVAEKPLWASDGTVYAQAARTNGNFRIVLLNAADGTAGSRQLELALPAGVEPLIDQQRGMTFNIRMQGGNQDLSASWDFMDQNSTTSLWPDGITRPVVMESGAALLDPFSGVATPVSPDEISASATAPTVVRQLLASRTLEAPFWLAQTVVAGIEDRPNSRGGRQIVLHRWNLSNGSRLSDATLFNGSAVSHRASSDQQHYLVGSDGVASATGIRQYRWSVYSLETGEAVGEIHMNRSSMPYSIVDGNLLQVTSPYGQRVNGAWVETPPEVRLLDLQSGAVIWAHPIRDTLYRGPVPSAQREQ